MVGHETLDLGVEVRILPRQLAYLRKANPPPADLPQSEQKSGK